MDKQKQYVPVTFQKMESYSDEDTRFLKVKIFLMHTGENLNGSYFDKTVVENAIPSLANTPILAYIESNDENEEDFSDHRMIIIKDEDGYKFKYIGQAIGTIPETNNAKFEMRVCDDGVEREFLTVEGLVWTKWDDPIDIFNRDMKKNQSMELHDNYTGSFKDDNLFHFDSFSFFGACALGKDVLPAMHSATIEAQFSQSDVFESIQQKMEQFKLIANEQEGGKTMDKKLELLEQYSLTKEELQEKGITLEDFSVEELEVKLKEFTETTEEETEVTEETEETEEVVEEPSADEDQVEKTDFSLVASQLKEDIRAELYSEYTEDEWGYKERKYWYVDHDEAMIIAEDSEDAYRLVGIPYAVENDKVTVDFTAKKKVKISYQVIEDDAVMEYAISSSDRSQYEVNVQEKKTEQDFSTKVDKVKQELETKVTAFNKLSEEIEDLREFKSNKIADERNKAETELFERFSSELTEEEVNKIKETASEFTIEQLEEKLFTLIGKKKFSATKQPKKEKQSVKVQVDFEQDKPKSTTEWAHLID